MIIPQSVRYCSYRLEMIVQDDVDDSRAMIYTKRALGLCIPSYFTLWTDLEAWCTDRGYGFEYL